jgi:hypothetical protein
MSETETSTNAVTTNAVAAANGLDAESQSTGRDKAIAVLKALNKSPAPTIAEKPEEMPVNPSPDATETPAAEETTEVKASPEAELKARLRAKAAAQEARERELEAKFAAREKELSDRASATPSRKSRRKCRSMWMLLPQSGAVCGATRSFRKSSTCFSASAAVT